ncbi:hypothetical protein, partial [Candidatus Bandiella numerosa]|uniref:hypothetical protein n=1 Tax=Candidatus Bandiella numerosa TaxID=2570586 RepID=UPI001F2C3781
FLEFLLFYQLLYQTYRSSLYESNFLNPFIAYLPCFAFMQRPFDCADITPPTSEYSDQYLNPLLILF